MYQLLAAGFLHPDRELARAIVEGIFAADVADTAEALTEELELAPDAARSLLTSALALAEAGLTSDAEALYHELAVEYARLFIGPPAPAVSPYESVHIDSEPGSTALLMVGPSARAVLAAYREAGVNMADGMNEPPDHIASEFEFMYYLSVKEAAALQAGESDEAATLRAHQVAFLAAHLVVWGPALADAVEADSTHVFYSRLSTLARSFLLLEAGHLPKGE